MKKNVYVYLLLLPGLIILLLFLAAPLFSTVFRTFQGNEGLTLAKYIAFFKDSYNRGVYIRTLKLALLTTLIAVILGFPTSYYISRLSRRARGLYIIFAVFPLLTSPVVRSFSWMVILGKNGILNSILLKLNLIEEPLRLLYNEFSIVIGLVYLFLPLMIMSLVGVMENIDEDLIEAAESLGATRREVFIRVIFPLSIPGLIVGSVLVFTGSITAYTTPQLLGGSNTTVLATLIYQNAMSLFDWDTASVVATIMILTTVFVTFLINKLSSRLNA
ncbi:MAG: putative spermidine/putrescine transport system permease protein [Thermosediminibacterales bacterium]|nr:putative spermidine/putrescine transport system permease protein [Thermosediminibacterales bacterium]MDK2835264.1 putative spermidine/putrescine transport system permease protein [Thermosediminibacterales bacterium]